MVVVNISSRNGSIITTVVTTYNLKTYIDPDKNPQGKVRQQDRQVYDKCVKISTPKQNYKPFP